MPPGGLGTTLEQAVVLAQAPVHVARVPHVGARAVADEVDLVLHLTPLHTWLQIFLEPNYPILLCYEFMQDSELRFHLAPKVEDSEGEDMEDD